MKLSQNLFLTVVGMLACALALTGCPGTNSVVKKTSSAAKVAAGSTSKQATSMASNTLMSTASSLIKGLSSDGDKKKSSVNGLVAMGAKVVPALINALKGGKKKTKLGVLEVLGKLGSKAVGAKAAVNQTAKDGDKDLQVAAKQTLGKISK